MTDKQFEVLVEAVRKLASKLDSIGYAVFFLALAEWCRACQGH